MASAPSGRTWYWSPVTFTLELMFQVTVACYGLSDSEGSAAVADVVEEFGHRPWQTNVRCEWRNGTLVLSARTADETGKALLDEFWDAVHAVVDYIGPVRFEVLGSESAASMIALSQAFLNGDSIPGVRYKHNDYVQIAKGKNAGEAGSLVTVLSIIPEPRFVVESERGKDFEVLQSEILVDGL